MKKGKLIFETVKHLKLIQIFYQIKYRLKKPKILAEYNSSFSEGQFNYLFFQKEVPAYQAYLGDNCFVFLNQRKDFNDTVDWNYQENGKLWNYNLQYANFLLQAEVPFTEKERLLEGLYEALLKGTLPLEPYPASLRIINAIRFYSQHRKENVKIFKCIYAELDFLSKRLEFHLLGNHLLENGFALMMGGAFFKKKGWTRSAKKLLYKQLNEQILKDGAHFELSPMYHQIIFFRLLELIDWYSSWEFKDNFFQQFLLEKGEQMLSWLKQISFENGHIPHFNDSTNGISFSSDWLFDYAHLLNVQQILIPLGDSGYRSVIRGNYECKIDFAPVGPSYQPGHAHADAVSFILYYKNNPLFVEAGTSTYEMGLKRNYERSTSAHNTVVFKNENQSEIWSGFRVGKRANTTIKLDTSFHLSAKHDGYKPTIHEREFIFEDSLISIVDKLTNNIKEEGIFYLHVYPGMNVRLNENGVEIDKVSVLEFSPGVKIELSDYEMATGFNETLTGIQIKVTFTSKLTTKIKF